jgi:predicted acylesterase/phospholipase RssA
MEVKSRPGELPPLEPDQRPPVDRFCDLVLDGGVINGVVYPGFLIELARKFRFHSLGGTSVGAIAASLAAACEYYRRRGSDNGFNEVLAKMPKELSDYVDAKNEITKIRSLFQPEASVRRLFDWVVDILGGEVGRLNDVSKENNSKKASSKSAELKEPQNRSYFFVFWNGFAKAMKHLGPNLAFLLVWASFALFITGWLANGSLSMRLAVSYSVFFVLSVLIHPLYVLVTQIWALMKLSGSGMCTGMRTEGSKDAGLIEWLYEGTQKGAGLSMDRPLTFKDLWLAPAGPSGANASEQAKSINLRMISTCLSHGRIYELPLTSNDGTVMFRLSELKEYFPVAVIDHLRRVSAKVTFDTCGILLRKHADRLSELSQHLPFIEPLLKENRDNLETLFSLPENPELGLNEPDVRLFPVGDLPIVVAARMSMSCPVLFQNIPLLGFNLDRNAEDISLVRLWFSDGGIGSNFPIQFFDQAIPSWPTFGMKLLEEPPRLRFKNKILRTYIPFRHSDGAFDNLVYPRDDTGFTVPDRKADIKTFVRFAASIYTTAKDGHDQSYLRMPDVRNRVILAYMNNRAGNMLNLKIDPKMIIELAEEIGATGGKNAVRAFLGELSNPKYAHWVDSWKDHRWVRLQMLVNGLKSYTKGFTQSVRSKGLSGTAHANTLLEQVEQSTHTPPLRSPLNDEMTLTQSQADALLQTIKAIEDLERSLQKLDLPQPYVPSPMGKISRKPQI